MPVSKVYMICNAYESGVGHGYQADDVENPYPITSNEFEAFDIGYNEGVDQKNEETVLGED